MAIKFAHLGDCHLGSWRFPELQELNMQSFSKAIEICIKDKIDFVLISGDLFDSAYPPIETLKRTFSEFKKLKENKIPCYLIAGSHDYSASGKTFLDVLEKAGFCTNVFKKETITNETGEIEKQILIPFLEKNVAIYGYPGKKSGLEIEELRKIQLQDSPGLFKILMLHTSIKDAIGTLPIDSIDISELPKADYYALAHLHIDYCKGNVVYSGPIFPNNFEELEELKHGTFYIIEVSDIIKCNKMNLKLKEVESFNIKINNSLTATELILSELEKKNLEDKIVLLRLFGTIEKGKTSDIRFQEIEQYIEKKNAFSFLKSVSRLKPEEPELIDFNLENEDIDKLEKEIIDQYMGQNQSKFNNLITPLINVLNYEKQEDEKNTIFQERLFTDLKKVLGL